MVSFAEGLTGAVFPWYGTYKSFSSLFPSNPMATGVQTQVTNTNTNAPLSWAHAAQNVGQTFATGYTGAVKSVGMLAVVGLFAYGLIRKL